MGRIVNDLDSIQFSIKKVSQLVKEIGRQVGISFMSYMRIYTLLKELNLYYMVRWLRISASCFFYF